jgi:hypothetical protein
MAHGDLGQVLENERSSLKAAEEKAQRVRRESGNRLLRAVDLGHNIDAGFINEISSKLHSSRENVRKNRKRVKALELLFHSDEETVKFLETNLQRFFHKPDPVPVAN